MPKDARGHLIPGRIGAELAVPTAIARPEYVGRPGPAKHVGGDVYDEATIDRIRAAGRIAADAIAAVGAAVRPGITTAELDRIGHEHVVAHGAYPSTLGYRGFPKSTCTSVNEVVCHGIPDDTALEEGDIVNVDITAFKDGVHGDSNRTFVVGQASEEVAQLVERTEQALLRGIRAAMPGRRVNVIGRTIEMFAKRFGYGVVRDFTGHGVGTSFHSGLIIPHYDTDRYDALIEPGMVFTIEPMLTLGTHEWDLWDDDWTVTTRDRSITAQFEHTIVVREDGAEILTLPS